MSDQNALTLFVGGEAKAVALGVGGRLFVFTPVQQNFLVNLQKLKNVTAAALSVDKTEEWGKAFLSSQKFRKYLHAKLNAFSERNGMDVDWWYGYGKKLSQGYEDVYEMECPACGLKETLNEYEVEESRTDAMELDVKCPACYGHVRCERKRIEFKPSREQVEGWKEIGNRLVPKTERVHYQFENVQIQFESEGEPA